MAQQERFYFFLFNDALSTFLIWLYGVGNMVKDHLDSEETICHNYMGYTV